MSTGSSWPQPYFYLLPIRTAKEAGNVEAFIDCDCGMDNTPFSGSPDDADRASRPRARQPVSIDCDCGLTPTVEAPPRKRPLSEPRLLRRADGVVTAALGDGEHMAFLSPYHPFGQVVVLNHAARALWARWPQAPFSPADIPEEHRGVLAALYEAALVVDADAVPAQEAPRPYIVTLWLEVTRRCNLRCPFCYVRQGDTTLSEAQTRRALETFLQRAAAYGAILRLKYGGGEPTLVWSHWLRLHRLAQSLAQQKGVPLQEVLHTNGTLLTPERLDVLAREGVALAVSLDGVGEVHDRARGAREGTLFPRVVQTIRDARQRGIPVGVTHTVTRLNVRHLPRFVAWATEEGLSFNLSFYRPRSPRDPLMPSLPQLKEALQESFRYLEAHLPSRRFIDGFLDRVRFDFPHRHACSAGRFYWALGVEGGQAPCPTLLHHRRNSSEPFVIPAVNEREGCASCPWRFWCGGGCPLTAEAFYRSLRKPSPYCEVYREALPALLRLEGLRVLREAR